MGSSSSSTSLDDVLTLARARVTEALGAPNGEVALRFEDRAAAARVIDRFAAELAALAVKVEPADRIGWHDDPWTTEQPEEELDRWRRMAASDTAPPRQSVVLGTLKKATPVPSDRRGPWARSDSEPPPADDHLPLLDVELDAQPPT